VSRREQGEQGEQGRQGKNEYSNCLCEQSPLAALLPEGSGTPPAPKTFSPFIISA